MPTTYDSVTGVPTYHPPKPEDDAPIGDGIEHAEPETPRQEVERLTARLADLLEEAASIGEQIAHLFEQHGMRPKVDDASAG